MGTTKQQLAFPPFQLDLDNERLWREVQEIPLRPKAFAVLRYLVEHPGRLVSRAELVQAVWGATKVSEGVLRGCLREIRQALEDSVESPRFIETVPRRGWRFIAPLSPAAPPVSSSKFQVSSAKADSSPATPNTQHPTPFLVSREAELEQLHHCLEKAVNGERQLVFVTGEPGLGKTTVVDAFLAQLVGESNVWIARGQCVEHYGTGEAYMPFLAAFEQLGRTVGGEPFTELLRRYAPMWLVQMPALSDPAERAELQRQLAGTTRERMLREIATLLEVLTTDALLVLVLEDLHWSDQATVELLAYLARRREVARLLVIGTYRPMGVGTNDQPLRNMVSELQAHGQCVELPLTALSEAAVAEYLAKRFPHSALPLRLAEVLHERTGGNPLFLVTMVEDLISQGFLALVNGTWGLQLPLVDLPTGVPSSLRQLLTRQMERVHPAEQQLLEAGSLAGTEFSAATVAAAVETDVAAVEGRCERLSEQQQFIRRAGISEWPDGTVAARYGFLHALYQQLWHERVLPTRRQQWHRRIGERLEAAYEQCASEVAAELVMHFEQGGDYRRAVQYLGRAGQNALRRSAYHEAINYLTKGLNLLQTLPDSPERTQQELILQSGV
jgi:predicted ATPase